MQLTVALSYALTSPMTLVCANVCNHPFHIQTHAAARPQRHCLSYHHDVNKLLAFFRAEMYTSLAAMAHVPQDAVAHFMFNRSSVKYAIKEVPSAGRHVDRQSKREYIVSQAEHDDRVQMLDRMGLMFAQLPQQRIAYMCRDLGIQ